MKKLICFLLVLCLLCPTASVFAVEPLFAGGDGTPENPYQIATLEQLTTFREMVCAGNTDICAKLVADIVINADPAASVRTGNADDLVTFTPIGTLDYPYIGTFDGNGHSITGLYCDIYYGYEEILNRYSEYALFSCIREGGTIKNLNLDKMYLSFSAKHKPIFLAGLAVFNYGTIENCSVSGSIVATTTAGFVYIGGICTTGMSDSNFQNCRSNCDISLKIDNGSLFVGGICAASGNFENCTNYSDIRVSLSGKTVPNRKDSAAVGGIVGSIASRKLESCYNLGNISVDLGKDSYGAEVGGIIGGFALQDSSSPVPHGLYNFGNISAKAGTVSAGGCVGYGNGTVDTCYNRGVVSATCTAENAFVCTGGIAGQVSNSSRNMYNYNDVSATGKTDSKIRSGGITGNDLWKLSHAYNLGKVSASGNHSAIAQAISAYTSSSSEIQEVYSLVGVAPLDESCTALTQEQFKTLWTDETHPEWNYAPVFEDALYQETPFCDTNPRSWYYDATVYTYLNQLMNGTSMTTFDPNLRMTRAMLVTVLYRMAGSPDVSGMNTSFPDLPSNAWYTNAVIWAANHGIVNGYQEDGKFHPEWNITRQDIATVFYRYVTGYLGETPDVSGNLSAFPDGNNVAAYARDAMAWANGAGLITGTREGNQTLLDPRGAATRAQIATILMRYCKNTAQ